MTSPAYSNTRTAEPVVVPASLLRDYRDPIGPPTRPVQVKTFIIHCRSARTKATEALERLTSALESSSALAKIEERCSVRKYADEASEIHLDLACRNELERVATLKQVVSMKRATRNKHTLPDSGDVDGPTTPASPDSQNPGIADTEKDALDDDTLRLVPDRISDMVQQLQTDKIPLRILGSLDGSTYFMRKSRTTDYNSLTGAQLERSTAQTLDHNATDQLSQIVYTLRLQPTARASTVSTETNAQQTIPFPPRQQVMHVLGSTTLAEVRDACKLGGDNVPAIDDASNSASDSTDDDSDCDGERRQAYEPRAKRRRREYDRRAAARELGLPQWTQERRVTGCAFAIDGKLYADGRDHVTNYADMILQLMGSDGTWPAPSKKSTDLRYRRNNQITSLSMIPGSLPLIEPEGSAAMPFDPHDVYSKAEQTIQEARIGDLNLRIGQPYWYIHQGNCEHVWTVEEIRHLHPLDPTASEPGESAPYPRTTFLSRGLALSKCRLCDMSPGEIITLNDDLAGDTPTLLCRICYDLLHVDADGNEDDVVKIPVIYES